jgi:hypothetical protein
MLYWVGLAGLETKFMILRDHKYKVRGIEDCLKLYQLGFHLDLQRIVNKLYIIVQDLFQFKKQHR